MRLLKVIQKTIQGQNTSVGLHRSLHNLILDKSAKTKPWMFITVLNFQGSKCLTSYLK